MDTLIALYPVGLTIAIIIMLVVVFFKVGFAWRERAKARGASNVDRYGFTLTVIPAIFLFLSMDVTMYHLGADIDAERLKWGFSAFSLAATWGIHFDFIVPHILRINMSNLWRPTPLTLRGFLSGALVFLLTCAVTIASDSLSEFIFDKYAPCVFNFS